MYKFKFTLILLLLYYMPVWGQEGFLVLKNGHTLPGDITRLSDGRIRVSRYGSIVYFHPYEIKSINGGTPVKQNEQKEYKKFCRALKNTPVFSGAQTGSYDSSYDSLIHRASKNVRLDSALIKAVIEVESGFNSRGVSCKGAQGLMQLMPETALALGVQDPFDPQQNIFGGSRYLRDMLNLFNGDIKLALAAYNAGPDAVKKYRDIPPYRETRQYVRKVMSCYENNRIEPLYYEYNDPNGCLYLSNYHKNSNYKPIK